MATLRHPNIVQVGCATHVGLGGLAGQPPSPCVVDWLIPNPHALSGLPSSSWESAPARQPWSPVSRPCHAAQPSAHCRCIGDGGSAVLPCRLLHLQHIDFPATL